MDAKPVQLLQRACKQNFSQFSAVDNADPQLNETPNCHAGKLI
jgi:hypothetical protein